MNNDKLLYLICIIGGLLLVLMIYFPIGSSLERSVDADDAQDLSAIPFHQSFIDEQTCMSCHREARQINLKGEIMESMVMPHEPREICIDCHRLPNVL